MTRTPIAATSHRARHKLMREVGRLQEFHSFYMEHHVYLCPDHLLSTALAIAGVRKCRIKGKVRPCWGKRERCWIVGAAIYRNQTTKGEPTP